MKTISTHAIITLLAQKNTSGQGSEKGTLTFDEKHFKFGYLNVAYSNIQSATIQSEGLLLRKYYLVICDEIRRYQFGPFASRRFIKSLPISIDPV